MHTRGDFAPETEAEARERHEELGSVARIVVLEVAKAMEFGREEYDERVTAEVVGRARDTLFAQGLAVHVGTREEFEEWEADHDGEVAVLGSENVDNVAWHAPPFAEGVAATFQEEADAAVETLRRQAFGRIYRDRL